MLKIAILLLIIVITALLLLLIFGLGAFLGASGKLCVFLSKSNTAPKIAEKTVKEKKAVKAWDSFMHYNGSTPQDIIDRRKR